jgi:endoglucanase
MVEYMKQVATKKKIKYQLEILTAGGTDTAGMQKMAKNGTIAGAVSIPTRNIHQVIEMCDKDDIRGSIDLLKESVKNLDTFKWDHK